MMFFCFEFNVLCACFEGIWSVSPNLKHIQYGCTSWTSSKTMNPLISRKFRSRTSDLWTDRCSNSGGKSQRRERIRREKVREERVSRTKIKMCEKIEKSRTTLFCQCFVAPKSRLAKNAKSTSCSEQFWKLTCCEKGHGAVVRSRWLNQNAKNILCSEHFWKLTCWKSARSCSAKHIFKSKVLKAVGFGPLLEVERLNKCTLLRRDCHFWRKSRRLASFWTYHLPLLREVSHNCFLSHRQRERELAR